MKKPNVFLFLAAMAIAAMLVVLLVAAVTKPVIWIVPAKDWMAIAKMEWLSKTNVFDLGPVAPPRLTPEQGPLHVEHIIMFSNLCATIFWTNSAGNLTSLVTILESIKVSDHFRTYSWTNEKKYQDAVK